MTTGLRIRLAGLAVSTLISCALMAQTATTGAVLGTISDASGAIVPKADIQLVNEGTGAADRVTTNDAGQFIFASVTPGRYRITSPIELLPFGIPQKLVHGTGDGSVPFEISEHYVSIAIAREDKAELIPLDGAGHFELVDPRTKEFDHVLNAILSLLG